MLYFIFLQKNACRQIPYIAEMQLLPSESRHTVTFLWLSYKLLKNEVYNRNSDTV